MKRLLSEKEALSYIGFGKTRGRQWLRAIGARINIGRSVRYDLRAIDAALDELGKAGGA